MAALNEQFSKDCDASSDEDAQPDAKAHSTYYSEEQYQQYYTSDQFDSAEAYSTNTSSSSSSKKPTYQQSTAFSTFASTEPEGGDIQEVNNGTGQPRQDLEPLEPLQWEPMAPELQSSSPPEEIRQDLARLKEDLAAKAPN